MWLFYPLSEILCVILQCRGDSCCSVQTELQNVHCCDLGILILLGSLSLTVCNQSRAASSELPEESGEGREAKLQSHRAGSFSQKPVPPWRLHTGLTFKKGSKLAETQVIVSMGQSAGASGVT